jgi:DNA-binding response OmpR family regulator
LGANDYIVKPFNAVLLRERVMEALGNRSDGDPHDLEH